MFDILWAWRGAVGLRAPPGAVHAAKRAAACEFRILLLKYYIENNNQQPLEELAKALDRSEKIVQGFLSKIKDETTTTMSSELYARDSNKVATIMTEAASMAADESRKKTSTPKRYKAVIHKIKED